MASGIGPSLLRQANDQRESQLPFVDFADIVSTKRTHEIHDGAGRDSVASDLILLDADLQHGLTGNLFNLDVFSPGIELRARSTSDALPTIRSRSSP